MEEKNCCEEKKECCSKMSSSHCCMMKKCHMFKWVLLLIALLVAFCLGSFSGRIHSFRGGYFNDGYKMMNWGEKNSAADVQTITEQITVGVN